MSTWIHQVTDRTEQGIAHTVALLIRDGTLAPGSRLPTVRRIAEELRVSPSTVSRAWRALAEAGLIVPQGRRGTTVSSTPPHSSGTSRFRRMEGFSDNFVWNLSTGTPDPSLLPHVAHALRSLDISTSVPDYFGPTIVPALEDLLRHRWAGPVDAITMVNGCMDGLDLVLRELVGFGDRVVVENPTFPPILDLVERAGAVAVGVPIDDAGMLPDHLSHALASRPAAVIVQPRAHNPTGASWSPQRRSALVAALAKSDTTVIENDHAGDVAEHPTISLAGHHKRTITLKGFSKTYGPDLRLAALGGPADIIERIEQARSVGAGWSSRILQTLLLHLLTDPVSQQTVHHAQTTYRHRRSEAISQLAASGIDVTCPDGLNLWLPVADEPHALISLAAGGVRAAPGSLFTINPLPQPHIRLTIGLINHWTEDLRTAIARASTPPTPGRIG